MSGKDPGVILHLITKVIITNNKVIYFIFYPWQIGISKTIFKTYENSGLKVLKIFNN